MKLSDATIVLSLMMAALIWVGETIVPKASFSIEISTRKGDRLPVMTTFECSSETWPSISSDCLRAIGSSQNVEQARVVIADHKM